MREEEEEEECCVMDGLEVGHGRANIGTGHAKLL